MAKIFTLFALFVSVFLVSCESSPQSNEAEGMVEPAPIVESTSDIPFVKNAETAHKVGTFRSHPVISADIVLTWRGNEALRGTMSMLTSTGKLRIDEEGLTTIYDGKEVYITPDTVDAPGARFGIFTWTYFMALPYKLNDPGTIWNDTPFNTLGEKTYDSKKLTFADGTGDSSLDWYICYTDKESHLLECAAYIVTYSSSQEDAEVDPHAVTYEDYRDVDGIPISHAWKFWAWREAEGLTEQLGHAELENIRFLEETPEMFSKPENGKLVPYERAEAEH